MLKANLIYILILCILAGSCHHENEQLYPEEFKIIVDAFFEEANLRGHSLQENHFNFEILFGDPPIENAIGTCKTPANIITIDMEKWEKLEDREKEWVIFHELGHCLLGRGHKNEKSSSSECYSYMNGTEHDFNCAVNYYSNYWRDYYLDELFDDSTSLPEWYLANQEFPVGMDFHNSIVVSDTLLERLEIDTFKFSQHDTFLFEIQFNNSALPVQSISIFIGNFRFAYCDNCTYTKTHLYLDEHLFYESGDIDLNADARLSIFRNQDIISFYINGYFVHAMEYSIIRGGRVKTNDFDGAMKMSLNYQFN